MKLFNIFNWVQNLVESFTFYGSGGGGGGQQTSYSTNLPEYAKPYYEELLKQTGKQVYETDADNNVIGVKQYTPYTGQRLTGLTDEQKAVQQATLNMQSPGGFGRAQQGLDYGTSMGFGAAGMGMGKALGYTPGTISSQNVSAQGLQNYQMARPDNVYAERAGSSYFTPSSARDYMDPYQQNVTDIALREARRQGDIERSRGALGAISRGTFGGARQALLQAEQDRNLSQNLADIQAKGSQMGYENAQKQFEADQARRMQAQQLNVQSGLQAMLANQQAGLTTGTQNLAALLGVQQLGAGQSLEAQKANQAANLEAQKLQQQGEQYAAGLGKDVGLAGLNAALQGSQAQGALAGSQQAADLQRLQAQSAAAGQGQTEQQKALDLQYQQFMDQQNYQKQQMEYLSNILRGNAGALGSTQTQYTPAPSVASQVAGLGLGGLGLMKALG
jgi:hypothetical protein